VGVRGLVVDIFGKLTHVLESLNTYILCSINKFAMEFKVIFKEEGF
jgi:hypothetical protein